jgi:hypothetical protein
MKTIKVTYRTPKNLLFNVIVPFSPEHEVSEILDYMARNYNNVTVIKIRPSVKVAYKGVVNYRIK